MHATDGAREALHVLVLALQQSPHALSALATDARLETALLAARRVLQEPK